MPHKPRYQRYIILAIFIIGVIVSCSTEKEAWLNRAYHNMTAHYNGYFNAREEIKVAMKSYRETYEEDYDKIIPVFIYPNESDVGSVLRPMEVAIEKTSIVITKNSMPNPEKTKRTKKEEWCKWIDDNWYVMGQAYFYKRDYEKAKELFKYISKTYPTQEIVFYADLWLAKTAIEQEDYATALSVLELIEQKISDIESGDFVQDRLAARKSEDYDIARPIGLEPPPIPKDFQVDLHTVYADFHLRKGEYNKAEDHIKTALDKTRRNKDKTRLTFILAQVYQEMGDNNSATYYYDEVTKMTAPYEMEFYARINRALLFSGGDSKGLKAELLKMVKDEKNKDYLDQIYYALAEIEFSEGNKKEGIAYLKKSSKYSTTNKKQQAKTYLRLGDIYYTDKKFPPAKYYYDSCLQVITDEYDDYDQIEERSEGLTRLVENIETYEREDSLLSLVNKGEKHYFRIIDDKIDERQRKDQEEYERRQNQPASTGSGGNRDFGSGANWYFYNEQAKAGGLSEFKRVWGDRKLEDDWRRSDKNSMDFGEIDKSEDSTLTETERDPYHRDYYLKDLPLTEQAQAEAHAKIAESLYNLGVIYKENLGDAEKGMEYFEELVSRYGDTPTGLSGMYQLYLGYKALGRNADSDVYKNRILEEYPDSEYAMIIRNPDYKKEEELARKKYSEEYDRVYAVYQKKAYDEVIKSCDAFVSKYQKNEFTPKFLLLKAYALGGKDPENLDAIEEPLKILAGEYKETEEGILATNILEKLRNQASVSDVSEGMSNYIYNSGMEHFFVLVYPNDAGNINPAMAAVSDFNSAFFNTRKLKTKKTFIDQDTQIIVVRSFPNKNGATQYLKVFEKDQSKVKGINEKFEYFIITHKNYAAMFVDKDVKGYMEFYKENYEQ